MITTNDFYGRWVNEEINKEICFFEEQHLFSYDPNTFSCSFKPNRVGLPFFIEPNSGSYKFNISEKEIILRGRYTYSEEQETSDLSSDMISHLGSSENTLFYKDPSFVYNMGISKYIIVNRMIELQFNYNFTSTDKLELIPVNQNSKRFLYFKDIVIFEKEEEMFPQRDFGSI